MSRRASAVAAALALASIAGCYQSHSGDRPAPPDGGSPDRRVMPPPGPSSRTYVISALSMPEPSAGRAPGANVDGRDSGEGSTDPGATCSDFNPDFVSLNDGFRGVDDAFGMLVPTIDGLIGDDGASDRLLMDAIGRGELVILVELLGTAPASAIMLWVGAPAGELRLDAAGRIAPNQSFARLEELGTGMGAREGSRWRMAVSDFDSRLLVDPVPLFPFSRIRSVELRFDESSAGLTRGELGGAVAVEDAVRAAAVLMPGIEETVRSVLESVADIDPRPESPDVCRDLSVGMTFEAVPARIVE